MKILQLGKAYPPQNLGGVEIVIQLITEGLHDREVYCDVLGVNDSSQSIVEYRKFGVIYREALIKKIFSTLLSIKLISRLHKIKNEYDIIHIHHPDPMSALALWITKPKCSVVLHWHSDILRQKKLLIFYRSIQTWLLNRSNVIIATSPNYAQNSQDLARFINKVKVVPIGVDKSAMTSDKNLVNKIREEYRGKDIILAIGRMSYYKGYEYLIKSCKLIRDSAVIIIIGKGELEQCLRELAEKNLCVDKIKFLGSVDDIIKYSYLEASDIFVLSSIFKTEAYAIVQVEAMAAGKPIISTEIPGSGVQWVNQNEVSGLTVPIKDSSTLAEVINKLIDDKAYRNKLSKGALKRYYSEFTLGKMIDTTIEIYRSLISN